VAPQFGVEYSLSRVAPIDRPHPQPAVVAERPHPDAGAAIAPLLSFLLPGLGQAYNRQTMLAWLLALPVVVIAIGAAIVFLFPDFDILSNLLDIRFLVALIVLDVALLAWRAVAIIQAYAARRGSRPTRVPIAITVGLLVIAVGMHAVPAFYAVKAIDTLNSVALGGGDAGYRGPAGSVTGGRNVLPPPSVHPEVVDGERVNFLLVGVDSGFNRPHALTDTMLVVSIDADGTSAMISVPRDLYGAPLPDGTPYDQKLNMLMSEADGDPERFPSGGVGTLKAVVGDLLGIEIHYFAAVNLTGFKDAVDAIGGVDITVERAIADPVYSEDGELEPGFYVEPGTYHMDGPFALAYVRSRHGAGDSDFTRAERQQELLTAIRDKLAGNLVGSLSALLDVVKNTISTDIPSARMPSLARAVQQADMTQLERTVIQPPLVSVDEDPVAGYILRPDLDAIRNLMQELLAAETDGT
jgi:LCP family protein required for cell wall assembly